MYKWPIASNTFSFSDRIKICKFFLNKDNYWTQNKYVKEYENKLAEFTNSEYAVFVSSGSSANQLLAQFTKDSLIKRGEWPKRNKVVVNSVTWTTNISVFIREGFEPIFIDVNLDDFCLDYDKLKSVLQKQNKNIACVFPTSVLGFTPNIQILKELSEDYPEIKFALDNCENLLGLYDDKTYPNQPTRHNICGGSHKFTTTTSCFIAHQLNTGSEGGFIFTSNEEEYIYYLMARAHGLIRNLKPYSENLFNNEFDEAWVKFENPLVDDKFDFNVLSSNYRGSDIAAFCGLLDFERINQNWRHRLNIYTDFHQKLDKLRYYLPKYRDNYYDVGFCLPIISRGENKEERIRNVKMILDNHNIEWRSFISGNMLRQTIYQKYGDYKTYENAEYLNNFAVYIGLGSHVKEKQVIDLVETLNKL